MENPITSAEKKFDQIADRYEYLQKIVNECNDSSVLKQCIEEQLATDKKYYETALEELINIVMKNFWNDREFAERYVMIARKLRLEDPQGFKERVDAASEGFTRFLNKNNVNN